VIFSLDLASFAGPEPQAAALADDIAYNAHDIDDGLRAGLFEIADLKTVPFLADLIAEIAQQHPGLERVRVIHELGRRLITRFVEDVIAETARLSQGFSSAADVRQAGRATVAFSPAFAEADRAIKAFLFPNMYRHRAVVAVRAKADIVVRDLFRRLFQDVGLMPAEWRPPSGADERVRAGAVADYIAGMTDRFALAEHRRLFDVTPDLV
jgi:dGTPase